MIKETDLKIFKLLPYTYCMARIEGKEAFAVLKELKDRKCEVSCLYFISKKELLRGIPHIKSKRLRYNTVWYLREDLTEVIRYYFVDILTFNTDGTTTFNTGGYHSFTTKQRINQYQEQACIFQYNWMWFIYPINKNSGGNLQVFFDGIKMKGYDFINTPPLGTNLELTRIQINNFCLYIRYSNKKEWVEEDFPLDRLELNDYILKREKINLSLIKAAVKESKYSDRIIEVRAIQPIITSVRSYLKRRLLP